MKQDFLVKGTETFSIIEGFLYCLFHSSKQTEAHDWLKAKQNKETNKKSMMWLDLNLGFLNPKSVSTYHSLMLHIMYLYDSMGRRKLYCILIVPSMKELMEIR